MAKKDIKRIFLGVVLIILAVGSAAGSFYFLEMHPIFTDGKWIQPKDKFPAPAKVDPVPEIPAESPAQKTSVIPVGEGRNQREGFLWVDHQSSQLVVTLGTADGLSPGKRLSVYGGSGKMGEVAVDQSFEAVSYVHRLEGSMNFEENDYYRVVGE